MGRYKAKRLKQDAGIDQSIAHNPAVSPGGEDQAPAEAAETVTTETALIETAPAEAVPIENAPAEAVPIENVPAEAVPIESAPAGTDIAPPRPKKSKWFWIALALYLAVLLAVSGFLQNSLWRFLANSQAELNQQEADRAARQALERALFQAPQLAFEDWQGGLTADYWTDLWYAKASSGLDVRESVREYMAERFAPGSIQAYKAAGFTEEAPVYVLKNGEDTLARVTLSGSELDWRVSEVELLIEGACSASVTVADSCRVFCNGREIGPEYAENAESRFRYDPLENRLEGAVAWVSYSVDGLLLEPELTVEPPEGYSLILTEEGDYLLGPAGDTGTYTEHSVNFVRAYLYYYMRGSSSTRANMNSVLRYLTPGTKAYQDILDTYNGVYWDYPYTGIDTSKTYAGNVLVWADNCFSVDVVYDADCISKGAQIDYADATMRIYFLNMGSGYVISNFEIL